MPQKMIVKNVIGVYPFLTEPRKNQDGSSGKYSLCCILKKDDPQIEQIKRAIVMVAKEKFGEKVKLQAIKLPLRDGDAEKDGDEFKNSYFFNANSGNKPQIVNRFNEKATEQDLEEYCYSGATFHVSISFYAFDNQGNRGVACGLNNVMLRKKTEHIGGGASAQSEFAEFADNADDEFENQDKDPYAPQNKQSDDVDFEEDVEFN